MSTKYIERSANAAGRATGSHAGIGVDISTNKIYVKPNPAADRVELVDTSSAQTLTNKTVEGLEITSPHFIGDLILEGTTEDAFETTVRSEATADRVVTIPDATDTLVGKATTDTLTNKTLTAPVLTAPTGTGFLRTARVDFVEDATSVSHTASVPIPAGAVLNSIVLIGTVAWGATSTINIGDTQDPDGYMSGGGITEGVVMDEIDATSNAGDAGAYWDGGSESWIGPTGAGNTLFSYAAGSNIIITINVATPSATTGRTTVVVYYTVPASITPVLA